MKILGTFYLLWNLVTCLITGYDKLIAGSGRRRVPEKNLLGMAALLGGVGVYAGMYLFRHKTKHLKFKYGVPLLMVVNFAVIYWIWLKF